ncbi:MULTISPECIES: flagellar export protein FliJ [Ignavibacterium]|jgi:flagellar export protein FliJ|uniref:flagellar export protein FliJ n=1 Tax=Ignavibacterium TaxID=795750 RepID=UPI0025BCCBFC|nr:MULTISPECIES: flagellar export protein FliJ [Ignavibacterium]MBI5662677.1 flagellar export protein FliJ [Ignavibacterium album]
MAKFIFRLDSIKRVKENYEKKAKRELAAINNYINDHQKIKEKLIEEVNSLRNNVRPKMTASELKFLGGYKSYLSSKIKNEESELTRLDQEKKRKISEVMQRAKEKKILNQLEEHQLNEFLKEANKTELKQFDEIAIQNFSRDKK